jgi:hypothetical protein
MTHMTDMTLLTHFSNEPTMRARTFNLVKRERHGAACVMVSDRLAFLVSSPLSAPDMKEARCITSEPSRGL